TQPVRGKHGLFLEGKLILRFSRRAKDRAHLWQTAGLPRCAFWSLVTPKVSSSGSLKRSLAGQPTSFRYLHIDRECLGPESIQAFFPQGVGLGDFSIGLQPLLRWMN